MPKDSIKATPIHHRGERRIKVEMPFEKDAIAKIKTVEGRRLFILQDRSPALWFVYDSMS